MPESQLQKALTILRQGGVIALPTDTVYGLAADAGNDEAVGRLFKIKKRPLDMPLPVMIGRIEDLPLVAAEISPLAMEYCRKYFPGALTAIFKKTSLISDEVTSAKGTVGVRIPDHPIALALLNAFGKPLVVTSANISGGKVLTEYESVRRVFGGQLDYIIKGEVKHRKISTIVDFTESPPRILRQGVLILNLY